MPTALDALHAAERRAVLVAHGGRAVRWAGALTLLMAIYMFGHRQGRAAAEAAARQREVTTQIAEKDRALDTLNREIAHAQGERLAVGRVADAAVAKAAAMAVTNQKLRSRVQIGAIDTLTKSVKVVIDPGTDSSKTEAVPAAVIDLLTRLVAQRSADSLAIGRLTEDRTVAEHQITLLTQVTVTHEETERLLKEDVQLARRSGFWTGVKVGAGVTVSAIAALVILRH